MNRIAACTLDSFRRTAQALCWLALGAAGFSAQAQPFETDEPTIAVAGVGRVSVAPDQAVVTLGATVQRDDAREAQRELDAVMQRTIRSIEGLGVAADNLRTTQFSLMPVYAEPAALAQDVPSAARRREEPRIVAYRATNLVQVTLEDLGAIGAVVDAGIAAGVNEIRDISFGLADDLPYQVTAIERAVVAARRKARAAADALGVRLAGPIEVRERSVAIPHPRLDANLARAELGAQITPGEIAIEATVDVSFALDAAGVSSGGD